MPQLLHFFTGGKQGIECPFRLNFAIFQKNNLTGTLQHFLTVRYNKKGVFLLMVLQVEKAFPEQMLCLYIQRA